VSNQITTEVVTKTFQTIQTHLKNDEWVKAQDEDLLNALRVTEEVVEAISQQLFVFIDCFEQYASLLERTIRVPAFNTTRDSKVSDEPTQTSCACSRVKGVCACESISLA
jgi:hypothetical protein